MKAIRRRVGRLEQRFLPKPDLASHRVWQTSFGNDDAIVWKRAASPLRICLRPACPPLQADICQSPKPSGSAASAACRRSSAFQEATLIRNLSRRLERLEARAATGKWTHMDRAEEQPPESSELRIARKVRWPEKVTDGNFVRACCTVEVCHLTDSRFWRMVDDGIVRVHQRTPIGFQMIRLWSSRLRGFQMKQLLLCPALFFLALPSAPAQIIVSGKVAVAEGGQLPDRVIIQRDCGGAPRTAAYADRKGQFNFRWSETAGITGDDASQSIAPGGPRGVPGNGIGQDSAAQSRVPGNGPARIEPAMTGCELRAAAPGYLSEVVALDSNRAFFDNYDVGTIFLHRTGDAEGPPASGTSSKAPSDARKAFDKGLEALGKGKTPITVLPGTRKAPAPHPAPKKTGGKH